MKILTLLGWINTIMQTDIATLTLLICVIGLLILVLRYKLMFNSLRYGLLEIYSQNDNNHKSSKMLSKKIRQAGEIKILLTTGAGFFYAFKNELLSAIKDNGTVVKILVGAKNSDFLKDVNKIEGRPTTNHINKEVDSIYGIVDEIKKRAGVDSTRISVNHFNTEFRSSMILIYDKNDKIWGKLTLTLPPAKAMNSISFHITGKTLFSSNKDNIFIQCEKHFNKLWTTYSEIKSYSNPSDVPFRV